MIDSGELEGLSPQQVFVLGWEACSIWESMLPHQDNLSVEQNIRIGNVRRVKAMCQKLGWKWSFDRMDGESENWVRMKIEKD